MSHLIEFKNVCKYYYMGDNTVKAVDDVSFTIDKGEFVAIVGHSGSGKSTCMNIIGCLDVPTSGEYFLNGENVGKLSQNKLADIRNKTLGFIFQQYNLLPKLSVLENVEVPLIYAGHSKSKRREMCMTALEEVDIAEKYKNMPNQLSGGQQQRVSIARALASEPDLILADEPTGALDWKTGKDVLKLLQELNRQGHTIVLITHDREIASSANRYIEIMDGKIVADKVIGEDNLSYKFADKVIDSQEDSSAGSKEEMLENAEKTQEEETKDIQKTRDEETKDFNKGIEEELAKEEK